jgi:hypothetical protein
VPEPWELRSKQAEFEAYCEKRSAQAEKRIAAICAACGMSANFQGDPRGYTVKIAMGGREDGWGVPQ